MWYALSSPLPSLSPGEVPNTVTVVRGEMSSNLRWYRGVVVGQDGDRCSNPVIVVTRPLLSEFLV